MNILLQSDIYGLHVFKDEEWIAVEPIPYAVVVLKKFWFCVAGTYIFTY